MAQCYVAPITDIPAKDVFLARVPAGSTFQAGAIVALSALDTTLTNNYQVYAATAPTATSAMLGIVINDGFEKLADGRRPAGQPDYTQYTYVEGDVVCVIALEKFMRFEITTGALASGASPAVGSYLAISAGTYPLVTTTTAADGIMRIDASKYVRAGGNFGGSGAAGYLPSWVCVVTG